MQIKKENRMKRKISIIALAVSVVLLSLMKSDSTVEAQQSQKFLVDTGVVALAPNQQLRVTVVNPDHHILEIRRISYSESVCSGDLCKQTIAAVLNSGPLTVTPGEAVSATFPGGTVRGVVMSSSRDIQVLVMIIDGATGEILSIDKSTPKI
jgi:hypothetical protein